MRSLRKVFGPRPSACGFSSAETWFPVKHQDSPLSEASRDLCFVVSGIGTDGRGFACVTLDRNTLIYIAGSQCVGGWVSINGSSHQAQSSPLFKSPFPGSFGSLSSFLWLNPVYLKLGVIAREKPMSSSWNLPLCYMSGLPLSVSCSTTPGLWGLGLWNKLDVGLYEISNLVSPTISSYEGIEVDLQTPKSVCFPIQPETKIITNTIYYFVISRKYKTRQRYSELLNIGNVVISVIERRGRREPVGLRQFDPE